MQTAFRLLDRIPTRRKQTFPKHLQTGKAGEEAALFHLRRHGFTVVAQGWHSGRAPGDLDLVAWEAGTLCFIEVKTRTSRTFASAESAVDPHKRKMLRRLARHYLRQMPDNLSTRFDIVSVYQLPGEPSEFELFRNAFSWTE